METIEVSRACELLYELRPNAGKWKESPLRVNGKPNWIFRGQRDAEWKLVPAAFRPSDSGANSACPESIKRDVYKRVLRFYELCDREGSLPANFEMIYASGSFESDWSKNPSIDIPKKTLDIYALAQHHGIKTHLLDWTRDPLTAAFFAAYSSWKIEKANSNSTATHFAIWAMRWYGSKNLQAVHPPLTGNTFMRRQKGCFTYDRNARLNYEKNSRQWMSHEEILKHDEKTKDATIGTGRQFLYKFVAPITIAEELLILLRNEGVDKANLMPSLNSIAEYVDDDITTFHVGSSLMLE